MFGQNMMDLAVVEGAHLIVSRAKYAGKDSQNENDSLQ